MPFPLPKGVRVGFAPDEAAGREMTDEPKVISILTSAALPTASAPDEEILSILHYAKEEAQVENITALAISYVDRDGQFVTRQHRCISRQYLLMGVIAAQAVNIAGEMDE